MLSMLQCQGQSAVYTPWHAAAAAINHPLFTRRIFCRQAPAWRCRRQCRQQRLPNAHVAPGRCSATSAAAAGGQSGAGGSTHSNAVDRLYAAINSRDIMQLPACFAADVVYTNLALVETFTGAAAVTQFYQDSCRALPEGAQVVLEQRVEGRQPGGTGGSAVAVVWHLLLPSSGTTITRGIAVLHLDVTGRIQRVTDSPEHPVKLSARGLTMFGPLVGGLAAPMLPAVQEVGRLVQQGMDMLLQPLEGVLLTPADSSDSPDVGLGTTTGPNGYANSSSSSSGGSQTTTGLSRSATAPAWGSTPPATQAANAAAAVTASTRAYGAGAWQAGLEGSARAAGGRPASSPGHSAVVPGSAAARLSGTTSAGSSPGWVSQQQAYPAATGAATSRAAVTPAARVLGSGGASGAGAAAGGSGGAGQQQQQQQQQLDLSGLWVKLPERSDRAGYEASLDVLGLSGLQKVTARLIDGIELQHTAKKFTVNFITVVPFFRVTEDVPLDGGSTQLGRRDLRFGQQRAAARSVDGGVLVEMEWGLPMAGALGEKT